MEDTKNQNLKLHDEIARLNAKLEESLAGLQAAVRLGDQVETKTAQINDLKEQGKAECLVLILTTTVFAICLVDHFVIYEVIPFVSYRVSWNDFCK